MEKAKFADDVNHYLLYSSTLFEFQTSLNQNFKPQQAWFQFNLSRHKSRCPGLIVENNAENPNLVFHISSALFSTVCRCEHYAHVRDEKVAAVSHHSICSQDDQCTALILGPLD